MLGGNDFAIGEPIDEGPATEEEFTSEYASLVATVRQKYPDAHVFLTVPPPVTDAVPVGRNVRSHVIAGVKAVAAQRNAGGDAKVYAFEPTPSTDAERTGCQGHGSPQFHVRLAGEIASQIRAKVGWN